jgi:3-deoxy-D-manno-octulosonic-acid transferase
MPVLFGPNNKRFQEAQDLKACGGGFEVSDMDGFKKRMDRLIEHSEELKASGNAAGTYVNSRIGATDIIMKSIFKD